MSAVPRRRLTEQEYLAIERGAEAKSEFYNGEMFAMAGASREHNLITGNIARVLGNQLQGGKCEVYSSDMRVKVSPTGLYTYPDVVVVCGRPEFEDEELDTLLNPTLLVEVLSESTQRHDRSLKLLHYRQIPSLREVVLVDQYHRLVEHSRRRRDGNWLLEDFTEMDAAISLKSIKCTLRLTEIYERIEL